MSSSVVSPRKFIEKVFVTNFSNKINGNTLRKISPIHNDQLLKMTREHVISVGNMPPEKFFNAE